MSSVAPYVVCADGQLYKDPTYGDDGWFICFDADEPPEIVIAKDTGLMPYPLLDTALGKDTYKSVRVAGTAQRMFPKEDGTTPFRDATSYFFSLTKRPSVPPAHQGVFEEIEAITQGVIIDPEN